MPNLMLETLFEFTAHDASTHELRELSETTDIRLMATAINIQSLGTLIAEAHVVQSIAGLLVYDLGVHTQDLLTLKTLVNETLEERYKNNKLKTVPKVNKEPKED